MEDRSVNGVPEEYFAFGLNPECEQKIQEAIKVLEKKGAIIVPIHLPNLKYAIPTYYANKKIEDTFSNVGHPNNANARDVFFYFRINTAVYGFMIAAISLIIQEVFGHWLSGDPLSRLEAIPNAILYAGYFSISHMFGQ